MRYAGAVVILLLAQTVLYAQTVDELVGKLAEPETAPGAVFKLVAKGGEATGALKEALSSRDAGVRYHALWALTICDQEIDGSVFVKLLDDENALVRLRAVFALAVKAPSQTTPILQRLASDPDRLVRAAAATVLADHRQPEVTGALLKSLQMHENRFAALALVSHGEAGAPGLRKLLSVKSPVVRRMACFALGRIGDEESLDALSAAARDGNPDVALSASVALALMHQDEAFSLLESALKKRGQSAEEVPGILKKVVKAVGALGSASPQQRVKLFSEVGQYGFLPPVVELVSELRKGEAPDARAAAAGALGDVGSDLGLSALAEASGDRVTKVRLAVATALGKIAVREGVAPLRQLSYDPDPGVRAAAAAALSQLDIRDLSPIFKRMTKDPESEVRTAALLALDIYPPSFTEPVFISLLKREKVSEVQALLITLLGRIATENALHVIINKADASEIMVRVAAIEALGNFSQPRAGQKLVAALKRVGTIDEKVAAVRALGMNRSELAVPVLLEQLRRPGDELGPVLAEALGNLGRKEAVPALTKALSSASGEFAEAILIALGKIAAPESLAGIAAVARDREKSDGVRRAAALALGGFTKDETAKTLARSLLADDAVAAEAAMALGVLGDNTGLAALGRLLHKPGSGSRLRAVWALRHMVGIEATALLFAAAKDADIEVALTAVLELLGRSKFEALAILQVLLAREGSKEKLRSILKDFELTQVLYPLMEKLAGVKNPKTRMAIVEVLGRTGVTDFRVPRDASLEDYQRLAARWIRWWEATRAKLPGGPGRIRGEEGETGKTREGTLRGLEWLKKRK